MKKLQSLTKEPERRPIMWKNTSFLRGGEDIGLTDGSGSPLGMVTTEMSALNHKQACEGASYRTAEDAQTPPIRKETGKYVKVRRRGCCTSVMLSDSTTYGLRNRKAIKQQVL